MSFNFSQLETVLCFTLNNILVKYEQPSLLLLIFLKLKADSASHYIILLILCLKHDVKDLSGKKRKDC